MSRPNRARRGVILLVVMSLIALFAVVTIGFVLVSTLELKTAIQNARAEQRADKQVNLLDEAVDQILRGTKADISALTGHSLLEDMYGRDTLLDHPANPRPGGVIKGLVVDSPAPDFAADPVSGHKFQQLVDISVGLFLGFLPSSELVNYRQAGYFNGRWLTFTSGPCTGKTVRIVDYLPILPDGSGYRTNPALRLYCPELVDPDTLRLSEFIINDRPFDGAGFGLGYETPPDYVANTTGKPDKTIDHKNPDYPWEQAFLPNRTRMARTPTETATGDATYPDVSGIGGADEDYDAADYQNMLLALRISTRAGSLMILPSLHRPDLIGYMAKRESLGASGPWPAGWVNPGTSGSWSLTRRERDLFRKVCLRPLPFDHPGFAAVNPVLANIDGLQSLPDLSSPTPQVYWDVDNDGDGLPDSVWVDLGLPVQTDAAGRRYKPLFAILCQDLDGRLNINAHGTAQAVARAVAAGDPSLKREFVGPFANPSGRAMVALGSGFGPADVEIANLFKENIGELDFLLHGRYDSTSKTGLDGRYGEWFLFAGTPPVRPMPGRTTVWDNVPQQYGMAGLDDDMDGFDDGDSELTLKVDNSTMRAPDAVCDDNFPPPPGCWMAIPTGSSGSLAEIRGNMLLHGRVWFTGAGEMSTRFGTRAAGSISGAGGVVRGMDGHYMTPGAGHPQDAIDDPYEIDLTDTRSTRMMPAVALPGASAVSGVMAAADNPFRPSELEALLRAFDVDAAALESRMARLAPTTLSVAGGPLAAYRRNLITTESWDPPVANMMLAFPELLGELPASLGGGNPITASVEAPLALVGLSINPLEFRYTRLPRLAIVLNALVGSGTPLTDFDKELRKVLYPEYFESGRLDLGRPLGNGWDDNLNNVIDEPGEMTAAGQPQPLWRNIEMRLSGDDVPLGADANNDGRPDVDRDPDGPSGPAVADGVLDDNDLQVRQALARHLFFLAITLRNVVMGQPSLDDTYPQLKIKDNRLTDREIAQWAVNVVDYIDADSISTGFEVDLSAGDGWTIDGSLQTVEKDALDADGDSNVTEAHPDRYVAWGVERPELLMTEALAWHDIRTEDTSTDASSKKYYTDPANRDPHLDQVRRPEGPLFIELYNPQGIGETQPGEFYNAWNTTLSKWELQDGVNLRAYDQATKQDPVWRIVVWDDSQNLSGDPLEEKLDRLRANPTFPSGDDTTVDDPDVDNQDEKDQEIERSIYFVKPLSTRIRFDGQRYYPSDPVAGVAAIVRPGDYAVVGRPPHSGGNQIMVGHYDTAAGSRPRITFVSSAPTDPPGFLVEYDGMTTSYPRFQGDGLGAMGTSEELIRPPVGVIIDSGENGRELSISEPAQDTYPAAALNPDGTFNPPADEPYDVAASPREEWVGHANAIDGELGPTGDGAAAEAPDKADDDSENVCHPDQLKNYRWLVLQRLANPLLPHDRETNPYLSVDFMPVGLTLFNSTFSTANAANLKSRERGGAGFNLFEEEDLDDDQYLASGGPKLQHTLGYLNQQFHWATPSEHRWWTPHLWDTLLPAEFKRQANRGYNQNYFTGLPRAPFPSIAVANRPLLSQYELMLVTKSRPSTLFRDFKIRQASDTTKNYFDATTNAAGKYRHLVNFFGTNTTGVPVANAQNDLYRIFDFIHVKSPFSGTETLLNPMEFASYPQAVALDDTPVFGWFKMANGTNPTPDYYVRSFRPPFNRLSTFREPGRINLNTIFDEGDTLKALAGAFYADANHGGIDLYTRFLNSRRGFGVSPLPYDVSTPAALDLVRSFPSIVSNPFRTFSGAHLVPRQDLERPGVNATLLRPDPVDPSLVPTPPAPLPPQGNHNDPQPYAAQDGLFELTAGADPSAPTTDPLFAYQLYNRLGNMVTTRSNVYAVWVTVGYFEVEPVDRTLQHYTDMSYTPEEFEQVYPDGYRLKTELGSDTGEIKRHRGFYLIDRSIPVGYERGETHNTRNAIILRRVIE